MASIGNIKMEVLVRVEGADQPSVVGHIQIPVHVSVGTAVAGKVEAEVGPDSWYFDTSDNDQNKES